MATQVQRRRGTTTEHATFTGAEGELTVDTTKDTVVVHDGATAGGFPLARENLSNVSGAVVNATVSATAAIAGSKISPVFGTQNVSTFGTIEARAAATQDGVRLLGRAGGTGNFAAILTPATLTADVTITIPATTSTLAILGSAQTFSGTKTFSGATTVFYNTTATQDGIVLAGRAGGTGSFRSTITPGTLTASRTVTLPDATGTLALQEVANTFTGANNQFVNASGVTFRQAATQDGVAILGRPGGTGNFVSTLQPGTLTATRILTLPDVTGTVITSGDTGTVTSTMIANGTIVDGDINAAAAIAGTKIAPDFGEQEVKVQGATAARVRFQINDALSGDHANYVLEAYSSDLTDNGGVFSILQRTSAGAESAVLEISTGATPLLGQGSFNLVNLDADLDVTGKGFFTWPVTLDAVDRGVLAVGQTSFTGTGVAGNFAADLDDYVQVLFQNKSADPAASCDIVVCNDQSSDSEFYGNLGMNSSTFTGTGPFSQPNNVYLTSTSADLCVGTTTNHALRFCVNDNSFDQARIDATALYLRTPLRFFDADASNYVAFASPSAVGADVTWTLPAAEGNPNTVLMTNGAGALAWEDVHLVVAKSADTTRNNSTALTADPELQFAMAANTTYNFKLSVFFSTTAAGDFKYGYTGPAGATRIVVKAVTMVPNATAYVVSTIASAYNTAGIALTSNATGVGFIELEGLIQNGANAGSFQFLWAQNTSDNGPTLAIGGSYIKYDRVP